MSLKRKTVSEKLLDLINPIPTYFDPEADIHPETSAKVDEEEWDEELSDADDTLSVFRKRNAELIEEGDERYIGRKISRKTLNIDADEIDSEDEQGVDSVDEQGDDSDGGDNSEVDDNDDSESNSDGEEDEEDFDGEDDSEMDSEGGEDLSENKKETSFQNIGTKNISEEVAKGTAIRNQLGLWDNLLECRIQLQKCMMKANRLPRSNAWSQFLDRGGEEMSSLASETTTSVRELLDKLVSLREARLDQWSETRDLVRPSKEIGLGEDASLEGYSSLLKQQNDELLDYRNQTLTKWNDKTRVAVGNVKNHNFSAFEQSTVRQIEQIMANKQRLIARTQVRRSKYKALGEERVDGKDTDEAQQDVETFDDDDFYHQTLRELIERKAADVTDPQQLGRQWIDLQKVRSKMKRKVEMKATKGRKIRFTVHQKLVNFTAPVAEVLWNQEARGELYNSLFSDNT